MKLRLVIIFALLVGPALAQQAPPVSNPLALRYHSMPPPHPTVPPPHVVTPPPDETQIEVCNAQLTRANGFERASAVQVVQLRRQVESLQAQIATLQAQIAAAKPQ